VVRSLYGKRMPNPNSYSLPLIAKALGVSRRSVHKWVVSGALIARRGGPNGPTQWRVPHVVFEDFLRRWSATKRGGKALAKAATRPRPEPMKRMSHPIRRCPLCNSTVSPNRWELRKLSKYRPQSTPNNATTTQASDIVGQSRVNGEGIGIEDGGRGKKDGSEEGD